MAYKIDFSVDDPLGLIPIQQRFLHVRESNSFESFVAEALLVERMGYALIKYPSSYYDVEDVDCSPIFRSDRFLFRSPNFTTLPDTFVNGHPIPRPYGWLYRDQYSYVNPSANAQATFLLDSDF